MSLWELSCALKSSVDVCRSLKSSRAFRTLGNPGELSGALRSLGVLSGAVVGIRVGSSNCARGMTGGGRIESCCSSN